MNGRFTSRSLWRYAMVLAFHAQLLKQILKQIHRKD
jgi:hypothetical protein